MDVRHTGKESENSWEFTGEQREGGGMEGRRPQTRESKRGKADEGKQTRESRRGKADEGKQTRESPLRGGWSGLSGVRQGVVAALHDYAGDHLISHTLSRAVPSAQRGLTSVFGMGTGGTLAVRSPANLRRFSGVEPAGEIPERLERRISTPEVERRLAGSFSRGRGVRTVSSTDGGRQTGVTT